MSVLDWALDYAARGWPVLPVVARDKRPLTAHGLREASTDPAQVCEWWERWRGANVGLRTGVCFDVLDIDGPAGAAAVSDRPPLDGPTVTTGHGRHVYVLPTGHGNRVDLLDHVDWRGQGGYVVAPPSVHPSGRRYEWVNGPGTPLGEAPLWLHDLLRPRAAVIPIRRPMVPRRGGYGRAALEAELARVTAAVPGTRNHTLNRASFSLGQLLAAGHLEHTEVVDALLAAGLGIGLGERECVATIRSGLRAGMEKQR